MIYFFVKSNYYESEFIFQKMNFINTFTIKILIFLDKLEVYQSPNKATGLDLAFLMCMKRKRFNLFTLQQAVK